MSNKIFLFCEYTENVLNWAVAASKALFLVCFRPFSERSNQNFIRSKNYSIIENFFWMIFRIFSNICIKIGGGV